MLTARGLVVAPAGRGAHEPVACGPLDLDLEDGGWLTLRGGNGAGKSTLLAALAGLAAPVAGQVRIGGLDPFAPAERRQARAQVGVVFQEPETQGLTDAVEREIAFPLENLGWPRAAVDARVAELLAAFGLEPVRAAPPAHLSGGEAQRVTLAAAMAPRPRLLLLDEPASYLDPAGRAALLGAVQELRTRDGTAVVWSACDPGEAPETGLILDLGGGLAFTDPSAGAGKGATGRPEAGPGGILWSGTGLRLVRRDERGRVELWGGLDFAIRAGERVVLAGANGSGKTALLDALAGLDEPGREGRLARSVPGPGYLTQFPESQLFGATVGDDVGFALRHRRRNGRLPASDRQVRVRQAIGQVGLDPAKAEGRAPDALSLGEQRRVALAGILVASPRAVLLDEPTAGLDGPGREGLEAALEAAAGSGVTLVVASHDPRWTGRTGWRILSLSDAVREPAGTRSSQHTRP
jgi:energy-coupling factor transporter ATP-binding protein EcfA2